MKGLKLAVGLSLLILAGLAVFWFLTAPNYLPGNALPQRTANPANGETMFHAGGCAGCHAVPKKRPTKEDLLQLGGGLALGTPFGTFKVPNISPDAKSGIGGWTEYEFANAMLRGVGRHGEHLYPAFPYTSYQRMRLDDVRDLFAYLKTLPPVTRQSEPHSLAFPFNMRRALGLWKLLFLDGKTFEPQSARSAELNRGAYLVEALGHCAECHSTRNVFGAIDPDRRFAGGPDPEGKGFIPNITQHEDGIAKWSMSDIADMLQNGTIPGGDSVGGSMAEVVTSIAALSAADRNAMAAYIKSLPPRPGKAAKKS